VEKLWIKWVADGCKFLYLPNVMNLLSNRYIKINQPHLSLNHFKNEEKATVFVYLFLYLPDGDDYIIFSYCTGYHGLY